MSEQTEPLPAPDPSMGVKPSPTVLSARPRSWRYLALAVAVAAVALAVLSLALSRSARATAAEPGVGDPAVVRCEPSVAIGPVTTTLTVDLYVENAANLYGADVRFLFDPTVAQVVDVDPFAPGVQIQPLADLLTPGFVIRRDADNASGLIWYAMTQLNPSPPVTGSGALARVTFQPLSTAAFTMPVVNHQLAGPGGVELPSVAEACTVIFQPCSDVNADGQVDLDDLVAVALRWLLTAADPDPDNDPLTPNYEARYDLDADGAIDVVDIMLVAGRWLERC